MHKLTVIIYENENEHGISKKNKANEQQQKNKQTNTQAYMDNSMKIHNELRHIIFNAFVMLFVCH